MRQRINTLEGRTMKNWWRKLSKAHQDRITLASVVIMLVLTSTLFGMRTGFALSMVMTIGLLLRLQSCEHSKESQEDAHRDLMRKVRAAARHIRSAQQSYTAGKFERGDALTNAALENLGDSPEQRAERIAVIGLREIRGGKL